MANDGVFDSSTFPAGIAANLAAPEPAATPAPSAPASAPAGGRTASGQTGEDQFGGHTPDVPFDEPAAGEGQQLDQQQAQQQDGADDGFLDAEPMSPEDMALLGETIHGVKGSELLKAIKGGGLPAEVLGALTNVSVPALEEEIHGVKGSDLLTALKGGKLPPGVLMQLKETVSVGGEPIEVTFREALDGYMRASDHTRKNMAAAEQRAKADRLINDFNAMIETWQKDPALARAGAKRFGFMENLEKVLFEGFDKPETLRQMLTRRGFGPALYQVADAIMQENIHLYEMGFLPDGKTPFPAGRAAAERMRQDREAREQLDRELWLKETAIQDARDRERARQQQRQQQRQQPQTPNPQHAETIRLINEAMPRAFEIHGIPISSAHAAGIYSQEIAARIGDFRGNLDDATLSKFVLESAQATKERLADQLRATNGAPANGGGRPPLLAPRTPPAQQQQATSPAAQQLAAAQQQRPATPNPSPLSPRPGATPTAPALPATFQQGGSSEEFTTHMAHLRRMGGGRR